MSASKLNSGFKLFPRGHPRGDIFLPGVKIPRGRGSSLPAEGGELDSLAVLGERLGKGRGGGGAAGVQVQRSGLGPELATRKEIRVGPRTCSPSPRPGWASLREGRSGLGEPASFAKPFTGTAG